MISVEQRFRTLAALGENADWTSLDPEALNSNVIIGSNAPAAGREFTKFLAGGARMPEFKPVGDSGIVVSDATFIPVIYDEEVLDTLKASKKAGRLGDFNSDVRYTNFPPFWFGKRNIPMRTVKFGREIGEFERRVALITNRLIDLGSYELVAFNEAHPEGALLGDRLPIAACERFLPNADGYWDWPYLHQDDRKRYVRLTWSVDLRSRWHGNWSFLVASVDELLVALAA